MPALESVSANPFASLLSCRWWLISIVVFRFWLTRALSSKRIVNARSHIIYSVFVYACILYTLVLVLIWKLNPWCSSFFVDLVEKTDRDFFSLVLTGCTPGSGSTYTSIMSFKWINVKLSVGALAYLNKNLVRSSMQNLVWNSRLSKILTDYVSFLK